MDPGFWRERWRNGEIGFHQQHTNPWLAYFYGEAGPPMDKRAGLRVFVPLCGKSLDLAWLVQNGYETVGVECSRDAVEDFFREQGFAFEKEQAGPHIQYSSGKLKLLLGDYFELKPEALGRVTDVFDRASLIALPSEMRDRYVEKMLELLVSGTRLLLITLTYPQQDMEGPPFSVDEDEVERLFGRFCKIQRLATKNILEDEPRLKKRGLTALKETAWKLTIE